MKQLGRKRAVLLVSVFAAVFLIVTALLWTPQTSSTANLETFERIYTLDSADVSETNQCNIDDEGNVEILGTDPFLVFSDLPANGRMVKVNFAKPLETDTKVELYINERWGFSEAQKLESNCTQGQTSVSFVLDDYSYIQLRLDINIPYQLDDIEVGTVEIVETNVSSNPMWFVWSIGLSLITTVVVYILDKKMQFAEHLSNKIYEGFVVLKKNFLCIMVMGVISGVASLILTGNPIASLFDIYEFLIATVFIFFVLCAIRVLWGYRNNLVENFEKVFVNLLLIAGVTMIMVSPFAHLSWDTDVHYKLALEASYLGEVKTTRTDKLIIENEPFTHIQEDPMLNFLNMGVLTVGYQEVLDTYESGVSLAHLPSGIFIALGRLVGLPFMFIYMFGKLANILLYTALCYFALKKLKSGKLILAVIALFPTNVFLACNYSYDYWVTAFSLLGMAYFVGELQDREKTISTKDTLIMCGALGLSCIPKKIYFPLLLIPFLMPKNKIDNKKKYYAICILSLIFTMLMFMDAAAGQTMGTGDTRGGSTVGPTDQLAFIFGDIFNYAFILLKFLFTEYLTMANMKNYIVLFPYLTRAGVGAGIIIILLIVVFLFDRDTSYTKETKSSWLSKIYVVLMYFGGSALVATSLYIAFTPVGHETVLGCQARYIVPWIYPMLSILSMNKIKPIISKKVMYWGVTLGCFGVLFWNLATVFLPSVIAI